MGAIEDNTKWFFKKTVFLWVPIAAIIILINRWREQRKKKEGNEE